MFFNPRNVFYSDVITFPSTKSAGALTLYSDEYTLNSALKSHVVLFADDVSKITDSITVYAKGSFDGGTSWMTLGTYTDLAAGSGVVTVRKEIPYAPLVKVEVVFSSSGALASGHGIGIDLVMEEDVKQLSKDFFHNVLTLPAGSIESGYFDVTLTPGSKETAVFSVTGLPSSNNDITVVGETIHVYNSAVAEVVTASITSGATTDGNVGIVLPSLAQVDIAVEGGVQQVETLTVTGAPSSAGDVGITLPDLTTVNVAVLDTDGINDVATKIRAATYTGWVTGGTDAEVTFTETAKLTHIATSSVNWGTTGATGTFGVPVSGVTPDTAADVATKIRGGTYDGWTAGGADTTITFTKDVAGAVAGGAGMFVGSTGVDGSITSTTAGADVDTLATIAAKIADKTYADWDCDATDAEVTFTGKQNGNLSDVSVSAGVSGVTFSSIVKTDGVATPAVGNVTIAGETFALSTVASADAIAADIAAHSFTDWTAAASTNRVTLTAKTLGDMTDLAVSSSATGVTFSSPVISQGIAVAAAQTVNGSALNTEGVDRINSVEVIATGVTTSINNTTLYVDGSMDGASWYRVDALGTAFDAATVSFITSGFVGNYARVALVTAGNGSLESGHNVVVSAALKY